MKFRVGDEVAYDESFGEVLGFRESVRYSGAIGIDCLVKFSYSEVEAWCWESDLSPADERRAELLDELS